MATLLPNVYVRTTLSQRICRCSVLFIRAFNTHGPTKLPKGLQYQRPYSDQVENVEKYRKGGFHPIRLGDTFLDGRYSVLHKLGYGGFSTVWLVRDSNLNTLVSLKVLTAEASQQPTELGLLRHIDAYDQSSLRRSNIVAALDDFIIDGPNGRHLCYVSQLGGPSLASISDCPGEIVGTRRLRAPLAREIAGQLARAVCFMHDLGIVHGDITPRNVILQLKRIDTWHMEKIYQQLGSPIKVDIFTSSGQKPDLCVAPEYLVEPADFSSVDIEYISDQVLLIDLGEAFFELSRPSNGVGTPKSYCSPELLLDHKAGRASDIWALSCTLFELRSGFPLFESFFGSSTEVLEEMLQILGTPPELSSHILWKKYGINIAAYAERNECALNDRVREIGVFDHESSADFGDIASMNQNGLLEPPEKRITKEEADHLTDLLRRSLDYTPEERLSAEEIASHPWLTDSEEV